ncbi:MAG: hypothetical protein ABFS21_10580 [Actinomycetota bacterium]
MTHRAAMAILLGLLLIVVGCAGSESSTDEIEALEQQVTSLTTERDAMAAQIAAIESRHERAQSTEKRVIEIIDDPDAFGTQDEVLNALTEMTVDGAVMDDTAFGAVGIRSAWRNTLYGGLGAGIKTWVRWLADDGSQAGSLWTWAGTAANGEPFELIGINLTDYDEEGTITNILVDWPYEHDYVRSALSEGTR